MKRFGLVTGLALVSITVLAAVVALVWTPYDPTRVVASERLQGPGWPHLLGTDSFGIDIASRLMVGARMCLTVGVLAVLIAAGIGTPLGVLAGTRRNWLSLLILRAADLLYAFPALLLAILLAAALGGSTGTALVAIGVSTVPAFVRVARAGTLQVMSQDYIQAARAAGTPRLQIGLRHVLPNIAPLIGVQASVSFGIAILAEAGLSYLGLGTPPPTPTWGGMLRDAQNHLFDAPMQALWPGLAIAIAVLGFNLLGDALRDYLDPRLREVA